MDINKLLCGVDCECGIQHVCHIQYVYIENGAIDRLKKICEPYKKVLIVADENTFAAAGDRVFSALKGNDLYPIIFTGAEVLVPDEKAIATVTENLHDCDIIIGIGSGVIQDLCKYISFMHKIPYIIVATAPSMDGYASDGAAMILGGMKVTVAARLPLAIVADTEVLKNAPLRMLKSGYGDIIGKYSALNDWKLSKLINGEYFCDYIYGLTFEQIHRTLALADGILKRDEESIKTLMEALVVVGILMSFAGSSRPASGSEHHLSHFFEITGILEGKEYLPHGIDVAYSTVITAEIREKIICSTFPKELRRPNDNNYKSAIKRIYGPIAESCIALQKKCGNYTADRLNIYIDREKEIKEILSEMPSPHDITDMLSKVELDLSEFYSLYGKDKIRDAELFAKDLKDRYSVLWLNYDLFGK